jgi:hypothetical protein
LKIGTSSTAGQRLNARICKNNYDWRKLKFGVLFNKFNGPAMVSKVAEPTLHLLPNWNLL